MRTDVSGDKKRLIVARKPYDVARDCMAATKGNRGDAAERYLKLLRSDKGLLAALMWPLLALAVRVLCTDVDMTSSVMSARISGASLDNGGMTAITARAGMAAPKMSPDEEREAARSIVMRDWYATRLYGGKIRLGDATRPQLKTSAERRFVQARGFMRGGNIEMAIAARLANEKQKVCEVLTPLQIHEIARRIK